MKKLFKAFLTSRHANKHLLHTNSHSMLIVFATATMIQFLFPWKQVEVPILAVRGVFLAVSFPIYVLSYSLNRPESHDLLVLLAFSSFIFYRIFAEDLATSMNGEVFGHTRTYWILVSLFLCTGVPLKFLLSITFLGFIALILQVIVRSKWEGWLIDIPLYIAYSVNGLILYYTFFCIGTEICRLRHRPLRSIKDLPPHFFLELEPEALGSFPLTVLGKSLSREEHLYILLRITQMAAFREAALQLIGEDSDFEYGLPDKDKLERGFLRSALIQFHLKECPNPTLRQLAGIISETGSEQIPDTSKMKRESSETFTTTRTKEMLQGGSNMSHHKKAKFVELNLFHSFGMGEGTRRPLEALASKITISGQPSEARMRSKIQAVPDDDHRIVSDSNRLPSAHYRRLNSRNNSDPHDSSAVESDLQSKSSLTRTVTVGTVTFPVIDVNCAVSKARAERSRPKHSSSESATQKKRKLGCFPRAESHNTGARKSWLISAGSKRPRNSVNEVLEIRLQDYDEILKRSINPMWDPISAQIDKRIKILQVPWIQRYFLCLRDFARWIQGVEAVMGSAQWRRHVHLPHRSLNGRFLDLKIERWFMAWVAPVQVSSFLMMKPNYAPPQARQHILLSPSVILNTLLVNFIIWDLLIIESYLAEVNLITNDDTHFLSSGWRYFYTSYYLSSYTIVHPHWDCLRSSNSSEREVLRRSE